MTRVYQDWKGSNIFCCWGLFIFGPDVKSLVASFLLLLIPGVLFCVFVAYPSIDKFPGGIAILPAYICLLVWNLFILLLTASLDPGIVPRSLVPPEGEEEGEDADGHTFRRIPRSKEVMVNGTPVRVKYCTTCQLYRPPRCSHCSVCDNCIERFDHHCPWVGQCIGKRNYPFFFAFISTTTIHCVLCIVLSVLYLLALYHNYYTPNGQPRTALQTFAAGPVAAGLVIYCFIAIWFVGGLTAFHSYLVCTNQTTYENFRNRFDKKPNPYSQGILRNIASVLCSKRPLSKLNFRAEVTEDSESDGTDDSNHNGEAAVAAAEHKAGESVIVNVKAGDAEVANGLVAENKSGSLFVPEALSAATSDRDDPMTEAFSDMMGDTTPRSRRKLVRGGSENSGSLSDKGKSPGNVLALPGKKASPLKGSSPRRVRSLEYDVVEVTKLKEDEGGHLTDRMIESGAG